MAIDTQNKRRAIGGLPNVPDGAIDSVVERKAIGRLYDLDTTVIVDYELLELDSYITIFKAWVSTITLSLAAESGITILIDEESRI